MSWTRAVHLNHWADMQESRNLLPAMIRRLIRATVPGDKVVKLPAHEQVQRAGFDGVVEVAAGNQFVPAAKSFWEMGVNKDRKGKADDDYEKRTMSTPASERAETTFVFVTPRTWANKDEWAAAKRQEGRWKDVIAWDSDDLEHWIETAPAVDVWLSAQMGHRPEGVLEPTRHWHALSGISDSPLAPQVFLCSREDAINAAVNFIAGPPTSVLLQSRGPDDGIDFLAALIQSRRADEPGWERVLFVTNIEAWRHLAISQEPLVLVATNSLPISATDVSEGVASGHHVVIAGSRVTGAAASSIELPRQEHFALCTVLVDSGFDDARARSVSQGCGGSSTILKRLITQHADRVFPQWSQDEFRMKLAPFALLGGWLNVAPRASGQKHPLGFVEKSPLDVWLVEQFGFDVNEIDELVTRWSTGDEPLFIRVGNVVFVSSREDAWYLLAGSLGRDILTRFEEVAVLILDEDNPALELEPDRRWMANLYGKVHSLSSELRHSVVETLALMASYPVADQAATPIEFRQLVRRVCERVLPERAPWQRWASLGAQLPLLFEADPEFFLSRVESDLRSDAPQLPQLFTSSSSAMTSSNLHCHLLWALEGLAWSSSYLNRVTLILARIAACARTTSGNNPLSSLSEIYLLWMPHTNTTVVQRLEAIEHMVTVEPDVGWSVIRGLMPNTMAGTSMMTHMPRWRPWAHGWTRDSASAGRYEYTTHFIERVMQLAELDQQRWSQIVEGMLRAGGPYNERVLARLDETAARYASDTDKAYELWSTLRDVTTRHVRFPDAHWAFNTEIINRLGQIRDQLMPQDAVLRHEWLFRNHVHLPGVDEMEFDRRDALLKEHRTSALTAIIASQGMEGIHRLLERTDQAHTVGWLMGHHRLVAPAAMDIPPALLSGQEKTASFTRSYCAGRFEAESWAFVDELGVSTWSSEEAATLGACLSFSRSTWDWIAEVSPDAEINYWQRCRPFLWEPSDPEIDFVIEKLFEAGRFFAASDFLYSSERRGTTTDSERILKLLEQGLTINPTENVEQVDPYPVQALIGQLQKDDGVDDLRLARIEWGYLGLLDRYSSETMPITLFRLLRSNPALFVDLLKLVYRAEDEEPGNNLTSKHEEQMMQVAHDLLDRFEDIPGTHEDGTIDDEVLRHWVRQVRNLGKEAKRSRICDHHLGKLMATVSITDQPSPRSLAIVNILEAIGTQAVFEGFENGVINNRGATTRLSTSGGEQERRLVDKYTTTAAQVRATAPKVAEMFDRLARHYGDDASWHDLSAERSRLGR